MRQERIQLTDNTLDVMFKMSDGNPGALNVLTQLMKSEVDQDSVLGGIGNILSLDTHGIYGSDIWILYKDICGEKINKMIAVLRAMQLGFYSEDTLMSVIKRTSEDVVPVDSLYQMVTDRLPNFDKANAN